MEGLSLQERAWFSQNTLQVYTLEMAVLSEEVREKAQLSGHFGENILDGAETVLATYLASGREALMEYLRRTDRYPTTADLSSIRVLSPEEALSLLSEQREEVLDMIRKDIVSVLTGDRGCERLIGIEPPRT